MDIYTLSRNFWDYAFENPEAIKPNHAALYFFSIEHCNRLGWKEKFGLPTTMVMEAIGIKSYNTYINTLNDLVGFGLVEMIQRSKNQYSANIIALSNFDKAINKALDKALLKHSTKHLIKQRESTSESISSIDIPIYNNTNLQVYNNTNIQREAIFKKWLDYKKEKKQSYKPAGLESLIKKFEHLTDQELDEAIEHSMAGNYSGIFQPKEKQVENKIGKFQKSVENISIATQNIKARMQDGKINSPFDLTKF